MHLIQDENGNMVAHSHEDGHSHSHSDENSGCAACQSDCGHHGHDHSHAAPETQDQMTAVLDYMLKHNEHHAAELDQMAAKLQAAGKSAAAEQIKKAVDEFQKGNLYLSLALSTVKEGK